MLSYVDFFNARSALVPDMAFCRQLERLQRVELGGGIIQVQMTDIRYDENMHLVSPSRLSLQGILERVERFERIGRLLAIGEYCEKQLGQLVQDLVMMFSMQLNSHESMTSLRQEVEHLYSVFLRDLLSCDPELGNQVMKSDPLANGPVQRFFKDAVGPIRVEARRTGQCALRCDRCRTPHGVAARTLPLHGESAVFLMGFRRAKQSLEGLLAERELTLRDQAQTDFCDYQRYCALVRRQCAPSQASLKVSRDMLRFHHTPYREFMAEVHLQIEDMTSRLCPA